MVGVTLEARQEVLGVGREHRWCWVTTASTLCRIRRRTKLLTIGDKSSELVMKILETLASASLMKGDIFKQTTPYYGI